MFNDKEEQISRIRNELEGFHQEKTKGAIVRARATWELFGESPTKYFLQIEKKKGVQKTLHRIKRNDGTILRNRMKFSMKLKFFMQIYILQGVPLMSNMLIN